ncbi:MAG: hypothetical protein QF916_04625, partial [Gammaproteobacteria bacterium]|nr:hypothetical protein [Gammaproteobacteria bacterium]
NVDLGLLILSSSFVHLYRFQLLHVILACRLRSVIRESQRSMVRLCREWVYEHNRSCYMNML